MSMIIIKRDQSARLDQEVVHIYMVMIKHDQSARTLWDFRDNSYVIERFITSVSMQNSTSEKDGSIHFVPGLS